jgi:coatomer subunit epsilon
VIANPLPTEDSDDYLPALLYTARAHIALDDPESALNILSEDSEDAATRAVRALAEYSQAKSDEDDTESALEELRDLCIEIEGEEEGVQGAGTGVVKLESWKKR